MRNKIICILITFLVSAIIGSIVSFRGCSSVDFKQIIRSDTIRIRDTITIHDTIRIKEPKPYYIEIVRIDTIAQIDTVTVTIPIERKTYQNEDYKAIIQGYKSDLISMDIYKKTTFIRDTILINNTITRMKRPRWVISVGLGAGYGPKGFEPYIGINTGFVLWSK